MTSATLLRVKKRTAERDIQIVRLRRTILRKRMSVRLQRSSVEVIFLASHTLMVLID